MMEGDDEEMLEASDEEEESQEEEQIVNDEHAAALGGFQFEAAVAALPPCLTQALNTLGASTAVDATTASGDNFAAPDAGVKASQELAQMIQHRKSLVKKLASLDDKCNKKLVECADATRGGLAVVAEEKLTQREEARLEESRLDDVREKLLHLEVDQDAQVRLTVGGQLFQATRATLTEGDAAGSMLAALYSNHRNNNNGSSGGDGGNNSNNNNNFLEGYVFHYLGNTPTADSSSVMGIVAKSIQHSGGTVCAQYDAGRVTHVVLATLGQPGTPDGQLYQLARKDKKRVVSWTWTEACIKAGDVLDIDDSPLYVPPPTLDGLPDMRGVRVCVTGYTGDRRAALIAIVNLLGAEYMRLLDHKSTHLVCFEFEGPKWAKANQTKAQRIVSHRWLEDCLRQWKRLPEGGYVTRSGKEEDELAAAVVPDSEPDEDDLLMNNNNNNNNNNGASGSGNNGSKNPTSANPIANAAPTQRRANANANGGVFIDRSAALFGYVLDWLRTGSVAGVPKTAAVRRGLLQEADFFGLRGLIDALKGWRHREMALSVENRAIIDTENDARKLLAVPSSTAPADVLDMTTLADGLLIDVFAEKDSFTLDVSPHAPGEDLTVLVDKRAAADPRVKQAFEELSKPNPTKLPSVCNSLLEFKDLNFKFFTMVGSRGLLVPARST